MDSKKIAFFGHSINMIDDAWSTVDYIQHLADQYVEHEMDDPFYVMDVGVVFQKHAEWCEHLPRIKPYYAVKCNTDAVLVTVLASLGCGFDCASLEEIRYMMAMGVGPHRIIYAHPQKASSSLREVAKRDVKMMTFDSEMELMKVHQYFHDAELILRMATPHGDADFDLSKKFGCDVREEGPKLLKKAAEIGIKVVGISFHVGSGCRNAEAYEKAISDSYALFQAGKCLGHKMQILDIGGGYPGHNNGTLTFPEVASVIRSSLAKYFPPDSNVEIIGEPGRFYATSAFTLSANVIGCNSVSAARITGCDADAQKAGYMYYINDGIYGGFNSILFEGPKSVPNPIMLRNSKSKDETYWATLWGPTCDNKDCVVEKVRLPRLEIGDWMIFENMGAYTISTSSEFNGFKRPKIYYMIKKKDAVLLNNILHQDLCCQRA